MVIAKSPWLNYKEIPIYGSFIMKRARILPTTVLLYFTLAAFTSCGGNGDPASPPVKTVTLGIRDD